MDDQRDDFFDDQLPPGFCLSCERKAAPGRKYCAECWCWIVAGIAIRRAATAIRGNTPSDLRQRR